ncbi:MAG: sigma-70 family RNA polymerase sigma factor [Planctomycetes bacterium]|nr:sigma-70 family RNA polymerase sigma factor [Planctomycetota bacterium]
MQEPRDHLEELLAEVEWLRRLSLALVGSPSGADDLCQDTLFAALRRPITHGTWRPWLTRVARNLASRRARSDRTRSRHERGSARTEATPSTAEIIERVTMQRRVAACVLDLPEPYRSTILQRFWEDLPPREIAARLGIPTETVRTRLKRAQAMLRKRLDDEHGSRRAWALPLIGADALRVGARATVPSALALTTWFGLSMKKLAILALLLVPMLVLGGHSIWPLTDPVVDETSDRTARIESIDVTSDPAARTEVGPGLDAATPASDALVVRGRCIDETTGTPISGCSVEVRIGLPDGRNVWRPWSGSDVAAAQQTETNGVFSLSLEGDRSLGCTVRIADSGHVRLSGRWDEPPRILDLGDVQLTPGVSVRGRVLDEHDAAVAPAFVLLARDREGDDRVLRDGGMVRASTDEAGCFRFDRLVAAGDYFVVLHGAGSLIEPRKFSVTPGPESKLLVRARRPDPAESIDGVVTDEAGDPIAGIFVVAVGEGSIGRTESDQDGRFVVPRADRWHASTDAGVSVTASHGAGEWDQRSPPPTARFEWGQHGVQIVMRELGSREIVVTDEARRPVEDCRLYVYESVRGHSVAMTPYRGVDGRGPHARGRLVVDGVRSGESAVLAVPHDERLSSQFVRFDGDAAHAEVSVVLPPCGELRVEVRDPTGTAVVGSRVEVVRVIGVDRMTESSETVELRRLDPKAEAPLFATLDSGTTDADGHANLLAPPERLWLRVSGEGHPPHVEPITMARGSLVHRIVVERGARLEARLTPPELLAMLEGLPEIEPMHDGEGRVELVLRRNGDTATRTFAIHEARVTADGLEHGEYAVGLQYRLRAHPKMPLPVCVPIGEASLRADRSRAFEFDITDALPVRVTGRIVVDGVPLRDNDLFLKRAGSPFHATIRIATNQDGDVETLVPPGEYARSLALPVADSPGWIVLPLPGTRLVARDSINDVSCDVERRRGRIRLLEADGTPIRDRPVKVVQPGYYRPGQIETDDEGWLEFSPLPIGAFTVEWTDGDGNAKHTSVDVPVTERVLELTIRT